MNEQNYKPVGIAIRELRENMIKVMRDSGLDPAVVVLVLKDLLQQLAAEEALHIQRYKEECKEEGGEGGPERR